MKDDLYLIPMTAEMYHAYFKEFENDAELFADKTSLTTYIYNADKVDLYIQRQLDKKRICLAVMADNEIAGEIIIKNIVPKTSATLGICMKNDRYKGIGYGTQAEILPVRYVFDKLDIPVLYADCLISNLRSQHVLEKVGFKCIGEDEVFRYYSIEK